MNIVQLNKIKSLETNFSNILIKETIKDLNDKDNDTTSKDRLMHTQDRSITDIIEDFMLEDELREVEMINVLKEQVEFLQSELEEKK